MHPGLCHDIIKIKPTKGESAKEKLLFDLSKEGKAFKLLNGTNGAPIPRGRLSNFDFYKAARIPYSRNHDCREVSTYGGAHCTDIFALFPDFDADPEDPAAYDFCFTDQMILTTLEAGTKTFFRLGETIENKNKHYTSYPPKDFEKAENILNEWNYLKNWEDRFKYSIQSVAGLKGASFALACICAAHQCPIDMLMYYDTRLSSRFNGVFDFYSLEPRKCYYSLYWYGMFYDMAKEIPAENEIENIYSLCGVSENGKVLSTITYYSDDDNAPNKRISLDFGKTGEYEIYLVDNEHNGELVDTTTDLTFTMKVHSMLLVKEK